MESRSVGRRTPTTGVSLRRTRRLRERSHKAPRLWDESRYGRGRVSVCVRSSYEFVSPLYPRWFPRQLDMYTFSSSFPSHWRSFSAAVLAVLLLGGCGSSSSSTADHSSATRLSRSEVSYQVGEPLADSALALVISSAYGTDTVGVPAYERTIEERLQGLSPAERSPDTLQSIHGEIVRREVIFHLLRGKASNENVAYDTSQVAARLQKIQQQYSSKEQFEEELAQEGLTPDSLRSMITSQLQVQALQEQMADRASRPTSDEVRAYSEQNPRIRAQHILLRIAPDAPEAEVDSTQQRAAALIDSARAGIDFSELAKRHSEGPSAERGGDLGFFTRDEMVDPFADAAFALSDSGEVASEPVRTRFGFHVIRRTHPGEPMDTTNARDRLWEQRREEAYTTHLNNLLQDVTVRAHPDVVEAGLYGP